MDDHKFSEGAFREGDPPYSGNHKASEDVAAIETTLPPIGRARRFFGLSVFTVGLLVGGRVLWLVAFYHEAFGSEEWFRSYGLFTIGTWLTFAGYWLAFRSRLAMWALLAGIVTSLLVPCAFDLLRLIE